MKRSFPKRALSALIISATLAGCGLTTEQEFATRDPNNPGNITTDVELEREARRQGTVFGNDGFDIFGLGGGGKKVIEGSGIGVNSFLWRASLDTIAFMPLSSADPFGGVIITDWYTLPEAPNERYKMSVYILGRQLRADGVRVAVFRQQANGGAWRPKTVSKDTAVKLENQILTRARQLRIASADQ